MDVQVFGNLPPARGQGKNTRSPVRPFDLALDGERAFVAILTGSEQAFPEHPFTWIARTPPVTPPEENRPHARHRPPRPGLPPPAHHGPPGAERARAAPSCACWRAAGRRPGWRSRRSTGGAGWSRPSSWWRLVVAIVLLATAAVARLAGGAPSAAGGPSPTSAAASSAAGVDARTVVVQPGDTLWSIAAAVAPDADVRITVDQLVAAQRRAARSSPVRSSSSPLEQPDRR